MLTRFHFSAKLACALAVVLALPQLALAHAVLMRSTPAAHATLPGGPMRADLKFNSRVDGQGCTLILLDAGGHERKLVPLRQPAADEIAADTGTLSPGSYTLRWQALASDGHVTRGEIPFRVR